MMAILDPIKLVIDNYPEGEMEWLDAENNLENESLGKRKMCIRDSHREESSEKVYFTDQKPTNLVRKLKEEDGKGIWICGGAEVVRQLVEENLIDCYYLTVIPVLLGSSIRLFGNNSNEMKLRLVKSQSYNGMTDLVYVKR